MAQSDSIERSPVPEVKIGEENVTFRLSGDWLARWKMYLQNTGSPPKSEILRDCFSLLFACASTDGLGDPVQIILRRKDAEGREVRDVDLIEFLNLPTLKTYRNNRRRDKENR